MIFSQKSSFGRRVIATLISISILSSGVAPAAYAEELLPATGDTQQAAAFAESSLQASTPDAPVSDTQSVPADTTAKSSSLAAPEALGAVSMAAASSESVVRPMYTQSPARATNLVVEPSQAFGSLNMRYPFQLPPGRDGLTPEVALVYSSEDHKNDSLVGYGWSLSIPYIYRVNKYGANHLYQAGKEVFASSIDGELKPITLTDSIHGEYRAELEDGSFRDYIFNADNSWSMRDKSATLYQFGLASTARVNHPTDNTIAYKWMLDRVTDTNSNVVDYDYSWSGDAYDNRYPKNISYGANVSTGVGHIFSIDFSLETRPDSIDQYYAGFKLRTDRRIADITIKNGLEALRSYHLGYVPGDNKARSMLAALSETVIDADGVSKTLPPTTFTYQKSAPGWTQNRDFALAYHSIEQMMPQPLPTLPNWAPYYVDISGDAYPDAFYSQRCASGSTCGNFKGMLWNASWRFDGPPAAYDQNSTPAQLFYRDGNNDWQDYGWQVADLNGDGISEMVQARRQNDTVPIETSAYSFNKLTNTWSQLTGWIAPYPFALGNIDGSTRLLDYNGDGLSDLVYSTGFSDRKGIAYDNTGSGWVLGRGNLLELGSLAFTDEFMQSSGPAREDSGFRIGDANGDGLADGIRLRVNGDDYVAVSNGEWFQDDRTYMIPQELYATDPTIVSYGSYSAPRESDSGVRLVDINGDGLVDIVRSAFTLVNEANTPKQEVYLGQGKGWVRAPEWENMPATSNDVFSNAGATTRVRLTDANADGMIDIIGPLYTETTGQGYINQSKPADYMTSATFSDGGSSAFTYKPSTQYRDAANPDQSSNILNPNLPIVVQTLERVVTSDGMGGSDTTTYEYAGGHYYFNNPQDRKFGGFAKVTETDQVRGRKTLHYFHQGNGVDTATGETADSKGRIGREYRTDTLNTAGQLLARTLARWDETALSSARIFTRAGSKTEILFNPSDSSVHKDKAVSYAYDTTTGNLTTETQWGEVLASPTTGVFSDAASDKRTTDYTYATGVGNLIGLPVTKTLRNFSGTKIAENRTYYDGLALGSAAKGNATKSEDWLDVGNRYIATTRTYNTLGLVSSETNPRGALTQFTYDASGLYPAQVTNDKNQITSYTHDPRFGAVVLATDPNGVKSETKYDGLGRVKSKSASSPATGVLTLLEMHTYDDTSMPRVHTATAYGPSGARISYEYSNGRGAQVQSRTQADIPPAEAGSYSGIKFAVSTTVYDGAGRMTRSYVASASVSYAHGAISQPDTQATITAYDTLDRPIAVQKSVGNFSKSYGLGTEITTDARGNQLTHTFDAFGNLVRVTEPVGITQYTYDALGRLANITDAEGSTRAISYDSLGRMTRSELMRKASAPEVPAYSFEYDDAGNRTRQVYPDGKSVVSTYDSLNRMLTTDDPATSATTESVYVYDTAANGIGKLTSLTTKDFMRAYSYDKRGNVARDTRTIEGALSSAPVPSVPSAPQTVAASVLSDTQIRVSWAAPATDGGSPVTRYQVSAGAGASVTVQNTPDASLAFTLSSLTPDTDYAITVKAENSAGLSPASAPAVIARTNPPAPPVVENDIIIYDDVVRSPWTPAQVNLNSYNPSSTALAGNGTAVIEANFKSGGIIRFSRATPLTSTETDGVSLRFATFDTGTRPSNVQVLSYGPSSTGSIVLIKTVSMNTVSETDSILTARTWYTYNIPMALLTTATYKKVTRLDIKYGRTGKQAFFDDIKFTVPGPLAPIPAPIYDDALRGGWTQGTHSGIAGLTLTSPTAVSGTAIAFTTSANPGRLHLKAASPVKVDDLQNIKLAIRTSSSALYAANTSLLFYKGTTLSKTLTLTPYFSVADLTSQKKLVAGRWYTLTIPAVDLALYGKSFDSFKVSIGLNATTVYLDDAALYQKAVMQSSTSASAPASSGSAPSASTAFAMTYTPATYTTEYTYADTGHLLSIKYPDAKIVSYTYGPSHQIRGVYVGGVKKSEIYYGTSGKPVLTDNGLISTFVYDPDKQYLLTSRSTSDGSVSTSYSYDAVGNITRILDIGTALPKDATFEYDAVSRLTKSTITAGATPVVTDFAYSPTGNMLSKSDVGAYEYTDPRHPHAATKAGTSVFTYDQNGNMVSDSSATYAYDYANRLSQITNINGITNYIYDDSTNRIQKRLANGARLSYIGNEMETDEAGKATDYIFANNDRILTIDPNEGVLYNIEDHLSSASLIVKGGALPTIIQKLDYYPYGTERINEKAGTFAARHTFTDKELDSESGLQYFGARYYNPTTGRFTSVDPVVLAIGNKEGFEASTNLPYELVLSNPQLQNAYSYTANNPLKYTDANGQFLDTLLDVGFIALDVYLVGRALSHGDVTTAKSEGINLGLDTGSAFIPFVAGLGEARRVAQGAGKVGEVIGKVADTVKITKKLPDSALVVRGTADTTFETFQKGIGAHLSGVRGFSAESGAGLELCTLCKNVPNNKVRISTVKDIRAVGGDVISTSGKSPNHATVTNISPENANKVFSRPVKNPVPKRLRNY